jgi:hypothetical protein
MLEHLITSKAKAGCLNSLLRTLMEISIPGKSPGSRGITKWGSQRTCPFRKAGLITSHRSGNLKYYVTDKSFLFFPELKTIIYGTIGLGDYLNTRFAEPEQIELAFFMVP